MSELRRCPECGAELSGDAPEGLCPQCLLRHGLTTAPGPSASAAAGYSGPFSAPTPAELAASFPQLEILEMLGQGGMGAVYKARQPALDRFVALKILPAEASRDPAFAERFTREARALARLNHPNVVTVYDFGQAGGLYYFVMEYIDGVNLRHLLRAGRLTPEQALRVVPQICDALQYAHEEHIVHRDIKPENILIDQRGRVKIADFGIAKLLGRKASDYTLTGPWQVVGTPHYMAPEQMERPLAVDHRADIYSLGVVFYEMLTGELPMGRFPPPSQRVQVDVRLDEVVLRAMEREPDRRYQHASDIKTEVQALAPAACANPQLGGASSQSLPAGSGMYLLLLAAGMAVGGLLMLGGLGLLAYAMLMVPTDSGEFWGWIGGAFGCFFGGAGALVGSWNSYRQLEGSGDLMYAPGRTWLDRALMGYALFGALLFLLGLVLAPWINWVAAYSLLVLGGVPLVQGVVFLAFRALVRRGAWQDIRRLPPAPLATSELVLQPGAGPRLLVLAVGAVISGLCMLAGLGVVVYAFSHYALSSNEFWAWMGGALGAFLGGGGGVLGTYNSYRQTKGSGNLMEDPNWTALDWGFVVYGALGLLLMALAMVPGLGYAAWYSFLNLGGLLVFQGVLFVVIRVAMRRMARQKAGPASPTTSAPE
jgi:predicted Ser/Thr protein kinase